MSCCKRKCSIRTGVSTYLGFQLLMSTWTLGLSCQAADYADGSPCIDCAGYLDGELRVHKTSNGDFACCVPRQCKEGEKFQICSNTDPESGRCVTCNPEEEYNPYSNWSYDAMECFSKIVCNGEYEVLDHGTSTTPRRCKCNSQERFYDPDGKTFESDLNYSATRCLYCAPERKLDEHGNCKKKKKKTKKGRAPTPKRTTTKQGTTDQPSGRHGNQDTRVTAATTDGSLMTAVAPMVVMHAVAPDNISLSTPALKWVFSFLGITMGGIVVVACLVAVIVLVSLHCLKKRRGERIATDPEKGMNTDAQTSYTSPTGRTKKVAHEMLGSIPKLEPWSDDDPISESEEESSLLDQSPSHGLESPGSASTTASSGVEGRRDSASGSYLAESMSCSGISLHSNQPANSFPPDTLSSINLTESLNPASNSCDVGSAHIDVAERSPGYDQTYRKILYQNQLTYHDN